MGRIVPPPVLSRVEDMDGGRVVMVVGAGPGVSGSVARRFAREGYDVALVGIDDDVLAVLSDELRSLGPTAEWAVVDITDVDAAAAEIATAGRAVRPGRRAPLQPERLPREGPALAHRARAAGGRGARRRGAADLGAGRAPVHVVRRPGDGHRQHGRRQAVEPGGVAGCAEGRRPQPGAQPRHHARARRHPRGVGDRARHPVQGGRVHPGPGGRGAVVRGPPGRVGLADRGARTTAEPTVSPSGGRSAAGGTRAGRRGGRPGARPRRPATGPTASGPLARRSSGWAAWTTRSRGRPSRCSGERSREATRSRPASAASAAACGTVIRLEACQPARKSSRRASAAVAGAGSRR